MHPAAKLIVMAAKSQDVVLCCFKGVTGWFLFWGRGCFCFFTGKRGLTWVVFFFLWGGGGNV